MFRKMKALCLPSVILFACLATSIVATGLGSIPYWESDSYEIGRWKNTPSVYQTTLGLDGFTSSNFSTYTTHARNQWSNAGISTTSTNSLSNAKIRIYGGNVTALALQNPSINSSMAGYAQVFQQEYDGTWDYKGFQKTGNIHLDAECYIVFKNNQTSDYYKSVTTHELGHALGWIGHNSTSTNVMYSIANSVTTLTTVDKRHLGQIY